MAALILMGLWVIGAAGFLYWWLSAPDDDMQSVDEFDRWRDVLHEAIGRCPLCGRCHSDDEAEVLNRLLYGARPWR